MTKNDLLLAIETRYNQLTKAEKKVADFVLQNPNRVLFMSITDLADACQVGDTSVFRFCKTMGIQGYQEFKMKLSLGAHKQEEGEEDLPQPEDDGKALAKKIMHSDVAAINEAYAMLDPAHLQRAVTYLLEAESIHFFGVGSSVLTAMEGMNRFIRITPSVHCIMDSHMQAMRASVLGDRDVAVVVSYSGSTKDTVQVAKLARERGAKVICITRYSKSPLTAYADATLLCGSNESPMQSGSISSKISQLYLMDLLYTSYYLRSREASGANVRRTSEAVLEKLY